MEGDGRKETERESKRETSRTSSVELESGLKGNLSLDLDRNKIGRERSESGGTASIRFERREGKEKGAGRREETNVGGLSVSLGGSVEVRLKEGGWVSSRRGGRSKAGGGREGRKTNDVSLMVLSVVQGHDLCKPEKRVSANEYRTTRERLISPLEMKGSRASYA